LEAERERVPLAGNDWHGPFPSPTAEVVGDWSYQNRGRPNLNVFLPDGVDAAGVLSSTFPVPCSIELPFTLKPGYLTRSEGARGRFADSPILAYPRLSSPILAYPRLSSPILAYPRLSSPPDKGPTAPCIVST
jgi:hypothetical protein